MSNQILMFDWSNCIHSNYWSPFSHQPRKKKKSLLLLLFHEWYNEEMNGNWYENLGTNCLSFSKMHLGSKQFGEKKNLYFKIKIYTKIVLFYFLCYVKILLYMYIKRFFHLVCHYYYNTHFKVSSSYRNVNTKLLSATWWKYWSVKWNNFSC